MSSTSKKEVKIDLATIDQNLKQLNSEIDKGISILEKGNQQIRQFLALAKTIKISAGTVNELTKQRDTLKSLGVPPNANIEFTIENAEIIVEVSNKVEKSLSSYLSSILAYDLG